MSTQSHPISFERYMHRALYDPQGGYYTSDRNPFGAVGDFVTAPLISPLFAYCVGNQCAQIFEHLDQTQCNIIEFGPGTGQMAFDVLTHLAQKNAAPAHYDLLEWNPYFKQQQQTRLKHLPHDLKTKIRWLEVFPENFSGVVLANEVLDAMPVHRLYFDQHGFQEWGVEEHANTLKWCLLPILDPVLLHPVHRIYQHLLKTSDLNLGYTSEINLNIAPWLKQLFKQIKNGVVLLLDYGFPFQEYYHPDRRMGTLMSYRQHQSGFDLLHDSGQCDLSAHVDFSAVAQGGLDAGFSLLGFTNQNCFLMGNQLVPEMEIYLSNRQDDLWVKKQQQQAIFKLCSPGEMGELVKVIGLGKNFSNPLSGFTLKDYTDKL